MNTRPPAGLQLRCCLQRPGFALDLDLNLPSQGITALFGPSGCGKTTALRCIAGLETDAIGRVAVDGDVWQDSDSGLFLPVHQRAVGLVFQEASLFDHLTVEGNLKFGYQRTPSAQRRHGWDQGLDLLGIAHLLPRNPAELSGGERQRVAIARALAASPRVLLMDEPLAALDAARKAEVLPWFERLVRELHMPMLYVTHSLDEVARLASHIALMDGGRIVAHGASAELMTRLDLGLAHGDAAGALVVGAVDGFDAQYQLLQVRFGTGGVLHCVHAGDAPPRAPGQPVRLRVQARDVSLSLRAAADTSILNVLPATVRSLADEGPAQCIVALDVAGTTLLARVTRRSASALALVPGLPLFAQVKAAALLD